MAAKDAYESIRRFTEAGCSKEMSEALLEIPANSWDLVATKADLAGMVSKADIADMVTKADLRELESRLEQRLTQRVGVMILVATSVMIAALLALELLGPR